MNSLKKVASDMRATLNNACQENRVFWESKISDAEQKKIVKGAQVTDPLAYFLVPALGGKGRDYEFVLKQFEWATQQDSAYQKNIHLALRGTVHPLSKKAIQDGVYFSKPRKDSTERGTVIGRQTGTQVLTISNQDEKTRLIGNLAYAETTASAFSRQRALAEILAACLAETVNQVPETVNQVPETVNQVPETVNQVPDTKPVKRRVKMKA
jgi:hypothetical protein